MTKQFCLGMVKCALMGALLAGSANSLAGTFNFSQAGFTDGGVLTGYFTGSDTNHDGFLTSSELTDFSATMHGSYYDGFTFSFDWYDHGAHITPVVNYRIGSATLGDETGEMIANYTSYQINYASGTSGATISGFSSEPVITSSEFVHVTDPAPVPEPSTIWLLLSGLMLMPAVFKRK